MVIGTNVSGSFLTKAWMLRLALLLLTLLPISTEWRLSSSAPPLSHAQARVHSLTTQVQQQIAWGQQQGMPAPLLDPFLQQEERIRAEPIPLSVLPWDTTAEQLYNRQADRLALLLLQVKRSQTIYTVQIRNEATIRLANLALLLDQSRQLPLDLSRFQYFYDSDRATLATHTLPSDAIAIRDDAAQLSYRLQLLLEVEQKLTGLRAILTAFEVAKQNPAPLHSWYVQDQHALQTKQSIAELTLLSQQVEIHLAQAQSQELRSISRLGSAKLQVFQDTINQAESQGISIDRELQHYMADQTRLASLTNLAAYSSFESDLDQEIKALDVKIWRSGLEDQLKTFTSLIAQAAQLMIPTDALTDQYNDDITALSSLQTSSDASNLASTLDIQISELRSFVNSTLEEVQAQARSGSRSAAARKILGEARQTLIIANAGAISIEEERAAINYLELQLVRLGESGSPGTYSAIAQQLFNQNAHLASKIDRILGPKVVTISLDEQVSRIYEHGYMVHSSLVTTGRPELPTVTGIYHIYTKVTPWLMHSPWPPGSPYWYPDGLVQYWMPFYSGYGLHDAPWRSKFGPGTNLPHYDPTGEDVGTHGCVNFPPDDARWLWNWAEVGTTVLVYGSSAV